MILIDLSLVENPVLSLVVSLRGNKLTAVHFYFKMKIDERTEDKEHTQLYIGNRKMGFEYCVR